MRKSRKTTVLKSRSLAVITLFLLFAVAYVYGKFSPDNAKVEDKVVTDVGGVTDGVNAVSAEEIAEFNFIDVGQGDCTLIKSPSGGYMLIDAGTRASSQKILDYLTSCGVETLEYALFTHPHEDHIGSADKVIQTFKPETVLMNSLTSTTATYERMVDALLLSKEENGTKIVEPSIGDVFDFDGLSFEVLADGKNQTDANNSSLVIRVTYGDCSFMFTGDAEKAIEEDILSRGTDISCILLKCGHHGSSTSSTADFVKAVNPKFGIISCGLDNSYGHPHVETLKILNEIGAKTYRTDEDGDIVLDCDGKNVFEADTVESLDKAA